MLFYVRTRTRENRYTLEQLENLGITAESVAERLRASYKGWLAAQAEQTVAFCMADRSTGELWVIAVLPKYEAKGIGNKLMGFAEELLWAPGCLRAWLTTDVDPALPAYGFYHQRGWSDWKIEDGLRWMELLAPSTATP
ncbi:MAG: GNAT family N-acetyltransferase [Burkholderiales bacterium]